MLITFSWNVHPLSHIVWSIDKSNSLQCLFCFRTTSGFEAPCEDSRFNPFKLIIDFLILVGGEALILIRNGRVSTPSVSNLVKKVTIFLKFDQLKWAPFLDGHFAWSYFLLLSMVCKFSQQQLLAYCFQGLFFLNSLSTFW